MSDLVHISLDPERLAQLKLGALQLPDDDRYHVRIGSADGDVQTYTFVNAEEALAISEAWRTIEQAIVEREHGADAVKAAAS